MEVSHGIGEATDEVCVTSAYAGVAETGTIVTYSGQQNPTTLNFLPPVHIAVLNAVDITGSYEDVWRSCELTWVVKINLRALFHGQLI